MKEHLCMIFLTACILFAAGCAEKQKTGDAVNCSPDQACYWGYHTPIDFLDDLKAHPDKPVTIMQAPDDWINKEHVAELMRYVDSKDPAAPVVSAISSYYPFNETSTVGNEALFLIEGYRAARYPPNLCSTYYFKPDVNEVKTWWEIIGRKGIIENATAIQLVKNRYRDLNDYPSKDMWPKTIETESAPDGIYVGFVQMGSGVPIISAECFYVGNNRTVRHIGTYNVSKGLAGPNFTLETCGA